MLTVRYHELRLDAGDRLLDLGCGGGRHAFEAARLGAHAIAFDRDGAELKDVSALFDGMRDARELGPETSTGVTRGDALALPFANASFDRIIAAEVLEHIPDDAAAMSELARVLRPGGTIAVTVPAWLPEQVCWLLSDEYHAPYVEGGHVRVYSETGVRRLLRNAGLQPRGAHHAHALHTPYWWLRCAVGPTKAEHPLVRAYHRLLVWDITSRPAATRFAEWALNPVLGKSLVVYAMKEPA